MSGPTPDNPTLSSAPCHCPRWHEQILEQVQPWPVALSATATRIADPYQSRSLSLLLAATERLLSVRRREGVGPETGGGAWDPLDLSGMASTKTLAWYRHAELKHGRVAMAAFSGWLWVNSGLPLFSGE